MLGEVTQMSSGEDVEGTRTRASPVCGAALRCGRSPSWCLGSPGGAPVALPFPGPCRREVRGWLGSLQLCPAVERAFTDSRGFWSI